MRTILLSFFLAGHCLANAQNLTGTWEGQMGRDFLQINLLHTSKGLCGYTYDHVGNNTSNYCKASFTATYNKAKNELKVIGEDIFATNGGHVLMRLNLKHIVEPDGEYLEGNQSAKSILLTILGMGVPERIRLRKIADQPNMRLTAMRACMEDSLKKDTAKTIAVANKVEPINDSAMIAKKDTVVNAVVLTPEKTSKDTSAMPALKDKELVTNAPKKEIGTAKSQLPATKAPTNEQPSVLPAPTIQAQMMQRQNEVISTVKVQAKQLTIKLYDNGTIDGDTISVFHNGKLLLAHQHLSETPIVLNIDVSVENPKHQITLFAENLGSIPPNTALLIIQAGGKRYELRSSADLSKNASIIFEYDGK
jgi:hypothetical protein